MGKDLFAAIPSIFGGAEERPTRNEGRLEALLTDLHPFKDHPFRVTDDAKMLELVESIAQNGIWEPAIVRARKEGGYEIIAGHRRKRACILAGLTSMPIDIWDVDDDTAIIMMVDTNNKRENLLPSEKAFAYKMKLEAIKRQGMRSDLLGGQVGHKLANVKSIDLIADQVNESRKQVQRYIRLTELVSELLDRVNAKTLPFNVGVELSYLKPEEQEILLTAMKSSGTKPNIGQAKLFKGLSQQGNFSAQAILPVLMPSKAPLPKKILETSEIKHFFPQDYSAEQMEQVVLELLKGWAQDKKTA